MDTLMFIEWPEGMVELGFLTKELGVAVNQ